MDSVSDSPWDLRRGTAQVGPLEQTLDAATSAAQAAARPEETGSESVVTQRLGRFVLLRKLGEGGMGTVYAAYDEPLDRKVALKLLHPIEKEGTRLRQRMLREAQAMARVSHPNVLHVYEVGELGSQIFIAMEYIDGVTLAAWQHEATRGWQEILSLYLQAGRGLSAAHQAGLVHRDFKPENVLVDRRGMARVGDFGLARLQGEAEPRGDSSVDPLPAVASSPVLRSPLSQTGTLAGTPGYMSPEQYRCQATDPRSDQFSFCVALFEALFGRRPFAGDSVDELAAAVMGGKRREIPTTTAVPIEIQQAILRGLSTEPSARFESMDALLTALDVQAEHHPAGAKKARRSLSMAMLVATLLIAFGIVTRVIPSRFTAWNLTALMGFVVALFGVGMLVFRRSLLANDFHRGLTRISFICVCTLFLTRLMAAVVHIEIQKYLAVDLMFFAGVTALLATYYFQRFWILFPCVVLCSFLTAFFPAYSFEIANVSYTLLPFFFISGWSAVASRTQLSSGKGKSSASDSRLPELRVPRT